MIILNQGFKYIKILIINHSKLFIFHFEISGKFDNDEHPLNIELKLVTLFVFHFEISGKLDNDEHPLNI